MEKKVQRNFLWIALLVLGTIWILARHNQVTPYQTDNGLILGDVCGSCSSRIWIGN